MTKLSEELVIKCARCRCCAPVFLFHRVFRYAESGEPVKLTLLDHAGQDIFYTLHHLFISRFGVYVVVFNMTWLWDDPSNKQQKKADESLSFLRFWLNSIFVHAQLPLGYEGREMKRGQKQRVALARAAYRNH